MRVLFLWHMHQPAYFVNINGKRVYYLPWVLQHGMREYFEMPYMVSKYDRVKVTFNLVPVLLEQFLDYAEGRAECKFSLLAQKPADSLTEDEIKFILFHFFNVSEKTRIRPYARFYYLYRKRGEANEIESNFRYFNVGDVRDLQFYWMFSAISPILIEENEVLRELADKKEKYSEEDKNVLFREVPSLMKKTVDLYLSLCEENRVEISTTPYYHPILPILVNSANAEISNPYTRKPDFHFAEIDNARSHVSKAMRYMKNRFGISIKGMWPAEGSVSMDTIGIYKENGVEWIASDEQILLKSLKTDSRDVIYKPYEISGLRIFFRDRELSDRIGFVYTQRDEEESAREFYEILKNYSNKGLKIAPIILDGENPWDYYANGGLKFLRTLYELLNKSTAIETSTFSDLAEEKADILYSLHPGSWIRGDFTTWVGHEEKNRAWKYLSSVKSMVKGTENPIAQEELMCAEGSDWFWWFGDDNFTIYYKEFDEIFRMHLRKALEYAGKEVPPFVDEPIKKEMQSVKPDVETVSFINPKIDGVIESFYEYLGSGAFIVDTVSIGQMKSRSFFLERIYFGFNEQRLFLMFRPSSGRSLEHISIDFHTGVHLEIDLKNSNCTDSRVEFAFKKVLEVSIPVELLGESSEYKFRLIARGEGIEEGYPRIGYFKIKRLKQEDLDVLW